MVVYAHVFLDLGHISLSKYLRSVGVLCGDGPRWLCCNPQSTALKYKRCSLARSLSLQRRRSVHLSSASSSQSLAAFYLNARRGVALSLSRTHENAKKDTSGKPGLFLQGARTSRVQLLCANKRLWDAILQLPVIVFVFICWKLANSDERDIKLDVLKSEIGVDRRLGDSHLGEFTACYLFRSLYSLYE